MRPQPAISTLRQPAAASLAPAASFFMQKVPLMQFQHLSSAIF
jgi:hypothetical protein